MIGKKVLSIIIVLAILAAGVVYPYAPVFRHDCAGTAFSLRPNTVHAAESEEPLTYEGFIEFNYRGPNAVPGMVGWGLTEVGFAFSVMGSMIYNILDENVSEEGNPFVPGSRVSTAEANRWLRDLARPHPDLTILHQLAILLRSAGGSRGGYNGVIKFELEEKSDGVFHLKSGFYAWGAGVSADFLSGFASESFKGSGSTVLDPSKEQIQLRIDTGSEPKMFELLVNIDEPVVMSGQASLVGIQVPINNFNAFGTTSPAQYIGYAELENREYLRINEIYTDVLENTMKVDINITVPHKIRITSPEPNSNHTFGEKSEGVLEFTVKAEIEPKALDHELENLEWTFPEVSGSTLTTDPEDRKGREVKVRYEDLPSDTDEFGKKTIRAELEGFNDPPPLDVKFFFMRDKYDNPDGNVPNWFYYWKQTSAAQGLEDQIHYSSRDDVYGFYPYWLPPGCICAREFYITDRVTEWAFNPLSLRRTEGIDTFAATVRHEWQHVLDYLEWWGLLYDPAKVPGWIGVCFDLDRDGDRVPDALEPELGFDPNNPWTYTGAIGEPIEDSEYTAYQAEHEWIVGTANSEDWANPGKNYGGEN